MPISFVGMRVAHAGCGDAAPVAALRGEAVIAQRFCHQVGQAVGDLFDAEALLARTERQPVAWQRRRHDSERVRRIATETARDQSGAG